MVGGVQACCGASCWLARRLHGAGPAAMVAQEVDRDRFRSFEAIHGFP